MERRQTTRGDGWDAGDREPPHGDPLGGDALGGDPGPDEPPFDEPGDRVPPHGDPLGEDALGGGRRFDREASRHGRPRRPRTAPSRGRGLDLAAIFVLLDAIRRAVPRELEQQLTALIREFLLTLRSLIDWYLDRLDGRTREPEVEEIPID